MPEFENVYFQLLGETSQRIINILYILAWLRVDVHTYYVGMLLD